MAKTWNQRLREVVGSAFGADVIEQNLEKAVREAEAMAKTGGTGKLSSFFYDPFSMFMGREWLVRRRTALNALDLRAMAKNPIIGSIVQTRLNQLAMFMQPSRSSYDYGFKIVTNRPDDKEAAALKPEEDALEEFLTTAGNVGYGETSLEVFGRKFMRDSLILDQANAEIVFRRNQLPAYFVPVDAATIVRLPASMKYDLTDNKDPVYAQIYEERVVHEYTRNQMMFGIRNPSTDIAANGYGMSELEMLVTVVTVMLNAMRYNQSSLAQGGTQKGILVIKGNVEGPALQSFKRDFREAVHSAGTQWSSPVLQVGKDVDVDWKTIDRAQKDMEYSQMFEFIVKLACAAYQIAPEEINWRVGQTGTSPLFQGGVKDQLNFSKDKGLRPLLSFFADEVTTNLIMPINPKLRMDYEGIGAGAVDVTELKTKEVTNYKTLNEVRQESNLDELPGGDIVLNPTYVQMLLASAEPFSGFDGGMEEENPEQDLTKALRKALVARRNHKVDIRWGQ